MILSRGNVYQYFLSNLNECVSTRESDVYVEGLNSKVKLELYKHLVRR